jgi:hypothetical protein
VADAGHGAVSTAEDAAMMKPSLVGRMRERIRQLENENASLRHDLERSMANHVADLNDGLPEHLLKQHYRSGKSTGKF